ncbi:hypothetical protein MRB53_028245 [Persea americana]|uniref:Uncharacterized protein n=1 Tax=Persea americana TaxID=3435 RepID=A0ACC2KFC4_PERAE|nr:hypothetical protein MRB53_028245 [Persea americana]
MMRGNDGVVLRLRVSEMEDDASGSSEMGSNGGGRREMGSVMMKGREMDVREMMMVVWRRNGCRDGDGRRGWRAMERVMGWG